MATITFNLKELIQVLISNELLREEILRPKVDGERIDFVMKTNSVILPYIPASLKYQSYSDNRAIFELTIISSYLNKALSRFKQIMRIKLPAYIELQYPKVFVDADKLLEEKNIRGIRVKEVFFEDGEFTIITHNI
jgi:hypothetical protein